MRTITTYPEHFKQSAVQKLLAPDAPKLSIIAEKIGIAPSTLYGWKQKYAKSSITMTKNKNIEKWTPEQKLEAIIKTSSMNELELGEYLRTNGLHSSDLETFKTDSLAGFKSKGRPKLDPELVKLRNQNRSLEKNLKKKDRALAEYSARVILLKKSHEIWGTPEDEE